MSLDWGIKDIKDWDNLCWVDHPSKPGTTEMNPVTNALIWETMSVGMNRITENNWQEFAVRIYIDQQTSEALLHTFEKVNGEMRRTPKFITHKDVYKHIGLHTNASPKTMHVFIKENIKIMLNRAEATVRTFEDTLDYVDECFSTGSIENKDK